MSEFQGLREMESGFPVVDDGLGLTCFALEAQLTFR